MGNMEEQNFDLLNIDQEDDNLLGISPANAELLLGVSPLSPSMMPKALKQASVEDLENCYGKDEVVGAPAAVGADLDLNTAPLPSRSPIVPGSVLSVLNFNEMNKRNVNRDTVIEEPLLRKGYCVKESIQLDGIAETSPVKNPGTFTSQLSRSYLDIENEQAGVTPEKGGGGLTILRKSRSRRSTTLRKSLAWDKAFFTDEGVLDNDELFAVASHTPKTLTMPELATIWDGPQPVIAPFEAKTTPAKTLFKPELRTELKTEVRMELRKEVGPQVRPEVRTEARPAADPKPQQDVSHSSTLRPDILHTSSVRPVRQIHTYGSHAFSNAYARAAAIPQGSTSIPLPNSLSRTGKQLASAGRQPIENSQGTGSDVREPSNTSIGLHHQARLAALKKAHEAPLQKGPRVRLPNSISNKKAEDTHLEEIQKVKQPKKAENKHLEEVHKLKQPKKVEGKPSEDIRQMHVTPKKQPELTRSMSTSALLDSPSALSRKVSSMSKKVKETLGKVMTGRARRVSTEASLSHVHTVEKAPTLSKRSGALPTVLEVKDPSHRTKSNAAVVPVTPRKQIYTVRDILRGKGPPSSPRESCKQGPILMRSKSACAVPGLPRTTNSGLTRVIAPSAPPPPLPHVKPSEPVGKPTGLRKPSPKLGFFDAGRVTSAPLKASTTSQLLQGMQPARSGNEASIPIEPFGHRSHGLTPAKISSAIPSAPHLRHVAASAPTSPRSIHVMHPSSPKCNSATTTRPNSPNTGGTELPVGLSGIRHAKQFAESHQFLAKKILLGDLNGTSGTVPEASALDSFKLPEALSTSAELNMEPAEHLNGGIMRRIDESNLPTPGAVNFGGPAFRDYRLESGGDESECNTAPCADLVGLQNSDLSDEFGETITEKHSSLDTIDHNPGSNGSDRELSIVSNGPVSSSHEHPDFLRSSAGKRPSEVTKATGSYYDSPRSRSFREIYSKAVNSSGHTNIASRDDGLPASACPSTPSCKDRSHTVSAKISRQFDSPRSKSFRETSYKTTTPTDSPVAASKHLRSNNQRVPWQSPGGKIIGDLSPGVGPSTPASGGKRHSIVSPSHAPNAAGAFEVLTPSSSKNARCVRTPGSSARKRKIVEFESPSSQWSNWPVLGAAISADQLPGSAKKEEGLSPAPPTPPREQASEQATEQATEQSTESGSSSLATLPRTPSLKANHAGLDRAAGEQCTEQSTHSRLSLSTGFVSLSTPSNAMFVEMDSGSLDRNPSLEFNGAEVCPSTPASSAKKDKSSSMFSFARKAVSRLTSPAPAEPFAQETEGTHKTSRRFSRSGSSSNCPAPEPKPLSPFSEARICELEAAGPEILEKKSGPVQNSPPDKVEPESNPWSPVRKKRQPLGPFDCTKLKYISPTSS